MQIKLSFICIIGLQLIKTRAKLDLSTVLKQIFNEYYPSKYVLHSYLVIRYRPAARLCLLLMKRLALSRALALAVTCETSAPAVARKHMVR